MLEGVMFQVSSPALLLLHQEAAVAHGGRIELSWECRVLSAMLAAAQQPKSDDRNVIRTTGKWTRKKQGERPEFEPEPCFTTAIYQIGLLSPVQHFHILDHQLV
jgi:hypothetical protein